jgi:N-acetylmuramoyl-L-alanine amidase
MRWSKPGLALTLAALWCAMAFSGAVPEKQLTVYTAQSSYSLPVLERNSKAYIGVTELLTPLGAAIAHGKGKEWKIELNKAEAKLTEGKDKALIRTQDKALIRSQQVDLGGNVLVESGRVLAPLDSALPLLSRLLNTAVDFHQPSRRIFVGQSFTRFNAEYKSGDRPSLVLNFTQPLRRLDTNHDEERGTLFTHTNKTTLTFHKDPVVSDANKQEFGSGAIQSMAFTEENGAASITVTGSAKLQIIRSEDRKTIILQPEAPAVAAVQEPDAQSTPAIADGARHTPEFFVMIDASHGGGDKGASFGGKQMEKDITLRLARELRKELEERGIAARLVRDSDIDIGLERRAEIANEQRAGIYVALHAGRPGKGVRVYAPMLADPAQPAAGRFLPWESAQSGALSRSRTLAQTVADELRKKGMSVSILGMPVRPLNNVVPPAIAVELAPEGSDPQSLDSPKRQNTVASAIASGIAQIHAQMGGRP